VFSGTVGGAMTGMMLGVPSIALSQAYADRAHVPWDTARTLGPDTIRRLLEIGWGTTTCLSVNFPELPPARAGVLTLARQGIGMVHGMDVITRTDPRGMDYHWIMFRRGPRRQGPESDIAALDAGKVVVTPLKYDRTDEDTYAALAKVLPR
jgi:5'-nucleotidase